MYFVVVVVVEVRSSSCTNESVLPSQHDNNAGTHFFFSPGWGGTIWVKSLAQGLNTMGSRVVAWTHDLVIMSPIL